MNVVSMLNDGVDVDTRRTSTDAIARHPIRSRTPWDAGGYALPILTHNTIPASTDKQRSPHVTTLALPPSSKLCLHEAGDYEKNIRRSCRLHTPDSLDYGRAHFRERSLSRDTVSRETPGDFESVASSRHHVSDSRSSLSSYASSLSLNSATHSRFSSMSTVEEHQKHFSSSTDEHVRDTSSCGRCLGDFSSPSIPSPATDHSRSQSISWAIEPLNTLALIAERRSQEDLLLSTTQGHRDGVQEQHASNIKTNMRIQDSRVSSPSDAMLIKRSACQELSNRSSSHDGQHQLHLRDDSSESSNVSERTANSKASHKRIVSAPDVFPVRPLHARSPQNIGLPLLHPHPHPTPPTSTHPETCSPEPAFPLTASTASSDNVSLSSVREARCMYVEDCDTNSTPRKAISHLLGRNKMCTRLIPPHVWVQYCRKHYQRARYRNMSGWPPLQCELVQQQIKRLEAWSDENAAKGSGPVVKDWTLTLRKREQARRDLASEGNSNVQEIGDNSEPEVEEGRHGRMDKNDDPPQAVPDWLFNMVGNGYSNADISSIFERIRQSILNKELPNMPDIEILPNIIVDSQTTKETKSFTRRKVKSHQRSKSLGGTALRGTELWNSAGRPSWWVPEEPHGLLPAKRKRFDDPDELRNIDPSFNGGAHRHVRRMTSDYVSLPQHYPRFHQPAPHMHHARHASESRYKGLTHSINSNPFSNHETPIQSYGFSPIGSHGAVHVPYPSPMMAPLPLRSRAVPVARTLQTGVESGVKPNWFASVRDVSPWEMHERPRIMGHARSRSEYGVGFATGRRITQGH